MIASLFGSSTTSTLPPRILAIYIHNGVKITASWLSALSESWDESAVEQIKSITSALESQLAQCSKSTDAELQERAAELGGLLQLVRQGLDLPRDLIETEPSDSNDADDSNGFATSRRHPPASLKLLEPLFFSHELNPVNPKAQSLVAPPEGLDLDTALHAGAWAEFDGEAAEPPAEVDDYGRPIRKFTSGGGDEAISTKDKKKKKDKSGSKKSRKRTPAESDLQVCWLLVARGLLQVLTWDPSFADFRSSVRRSVPSRSIAGQLVPWWRDGFRRGGGRLDPDRQTGPRPPVALAARADPAATRTDPSTDVCRRRRRAATDCCGCRSGAKDCDQITACAGIRCAGAGAVAPGGGI